MKNSYKEILAILLGVIIIAVVVLKWDSISWLSNYAAVTRAMGSWFDNSKEVVAQKGPPNPQHQEIARKYPYTEKSNSIEIPKINIAAPLVVDANPDIQVITNNLDNGVVYYPGSVLPGEKGQVIVLGHSAPENWPKIKYDWVFSDVGELVSGDIIILNFNNSQYSYSVVGREILKPGAEITPEAPANNDNVLILVTCWPPGKNYQRIAIKAKLLTNMSVGLAKD